MRRLFVVLIVLAATLGAVPASAQAVISIPNETITTTAVALPVVVTIGLPAPTGWLQIRVAQCATGTCHVLRGAIVYNPTSPQTVTVPLGTGLPAGAYAIQAVYHVDGKVVTAESTLTVESLRYGPITPPTMGRFPGG